MPHNPHSPTITTLRCGRCRFLWSATVPPGRFASELCQCPRCGSTDHRPLLGTTFLVLTAWPPGLTTLDISCLGF